MCERNKQPTARDRRIYDGDLKIITTNINEIFRKLISSGAIERKYNIGINPGVIVILAREKLKNLENSRNASLEISMG